MPLHTPLDLFNAEKRRLLGQEPEQTPQDGALAMFEAEKQRVLALGMFETEKARLEAGAGDQDKNAIVEFFKKTGQLFVDINPASSDPLRQAAAMRAIGAGILEGAILEPGQAVAEIPGVFGLEMGAKTADFLERAKIGLHSSAEKAGLAAGMTEEQIAFAYGTGDFIGFVAPIAASLKAATFLLRTPLALRAAATAAGAGRVGAAVTRAAPTTVGLAEHVMFGNLVTDMTAGAIFGGVFRPAETWEDRAWHMSEESALFGVMRIGMNTLIQPIRAFRNNRLAVLERDAGVERVLQKWRDGESVIIDSPKQALALSKLLSEEAYVTNSSAAQEILRIFQDEAALVQGIITASEAGQTAGIIRGLSGGFPEVEAIITKLRGQFPALKFTTVRRADGLNVFFGTKGLSNVQKGQFKAEGRIQGQGIEKNGIRYEYVRMRGDKIVVRTHTGKTTALVDENITDLMNITEEIPAIGPIEALYQDFSKKLSEGVEGLDVGGVIPEQEIIKRLRAGEAVISNEARRPFDIGTTVVYPEELGISTRTPTPAGFEGGVEGLVDALGTGKGPPRLATAEEAAEAIVRGEPGAAILEPPNVMSFESMVDAWAKDVELPAGAPDMTTIRAYFGQRARADFWKSVPDADMKILEKIRAEQFRLVEEGEIPLNAYARNKGFEVERGEAGTVILRHLATGRRVQYGSERVALNGLNGVINTEADMLGGTLLPVGNHGVGGWTGGFRPSDGIFTFDGKVPTREFINDLPLTKFFQNNMDMFVRMEGDIGVPLFSEVFNKIDVGVNANRNFYEPWAKKIEEAWAGLKINEKVEVTEAWRVLEGRTMTNAERLAEARALGLSKRQLKAFEDSRELFDVWGEMLGLKDNGQWIEGYYGRIQPYMERSGGIGQLKDIWGSEVNVPPQHSAFMMEHRTGDMPMIEMDPEVVMHRYLRTMGFKLHVGDVYEQGRRLVAESTTPKIGDLPSAQADALLRKALAVDPKADLDTPIMPPVVRKMIGEYLVTIKGNPSTAQGTMMRFGQALFEKVGVKMDRNVVEQYVNSSLSMMYGSSMGLKPSLWARDATQTMWMTYTRMGAEHGGTSLKQAMTMEGWQEVVDVGAIRSVEAGLAAADRIFQVVADTNAIKAINPRNPFHLAFASTARWGLRTLNLGSKVARNFLIPYSSQDGMNRAWSYFWFKQFTAKHLDRYNAGTISWDKFREDGLPFFHDVIKKRFGELYNAEGREVALRWIAKQGTDESNFIYGVGAQPSWMQNSVGRFAGMFGTWSMWAIEFYTRRAKNGTRAQRAALYARTVALAGAFGNMSLQTGINMWSWIAPTSMFGWAGGPFVDWLIQLRRAYKAPLDQKADALNVLANNVGRIALPGQGFVRDIRRSLDASDPRQGALMMILGRPVDDYNYSLEFLLDPRANEGISLDPTAEDGLRALQGLEDFPRIPITELTSPVSRRVPRQPFQP